MSARWSSHCLQLVKHLGFTSQSLLDIPTSDITTFRRILIEQHEAERDVGLILDGSQGDLRRPRRDKGEERADESGLVLVCDHMLVMVNRCQCDLANSPWRA